MSAETHPRKARYFDFNLCHSNRKRSLGFRRTDGFSGPVGMTNVPRSRRDWRLDRIREQKATNGRNSYLEEARGPFLSGKL